ncbi:MAG: hypothetical protein ACRDZ8_11845 [Acidimicrobiales bacterium]
MRTPPTLRRAPSAPADELSGVRGAGVLFGELAVDGLRSFGPSPEKASWGAGAFPVEISGAPPGSAPGASSIILKEGETRPYL